MADYFGAAGDLLSGAGALFGSNAAAAGSKQAANYYFKAADLTKLETGLKETAVNRQLYQTMGGARADVAANGLMQTGSAEDVMRSSAQQGALSKALVQLQGDISAQSYTAQGQQALATAKSQSGGGFFGAVSGLVGAAASIFSDDRLKKNIQLLARREDGIGLYLFQYIGTEDWYEGAIASDVERVCPEAIGELNGFKTVNYDMIGMALHHAGAA